MRSCKQATALSVLCVAAFNAQANSVIQATATISNLSVQFVDLNTQDASGPGFTFQSGNSSLSNGVWRGTAYDNVQFDGSVLDSSSQRSDLPASPLGSAYVLKGADSLTASIIRTREQLENLPSDFYLDFKGTFIPSEINAGFNESSLWILDPYSQVTITGMVQLSATVDTASMADHPMLLEQGYGERSMEVSSSSRFGISVDSTYLFNPGSGYFEYYQSAPDNLSSISFASHETEWATKYGAVPVTSGGDSGLQPFSLTITNNFDQQMQVYLSSRMSLSATVTAQVGVVPEPSTWALMLLGLGGLATAVRRQQRRSTLH